MKTKKLSIRLLFLFLILLCFSLPVSAYILQPNAGTYLWNNPQDIKWYYLKSGTYDYISSINLACFSWEHETSKFDYSQTTGGDYDCYIRSNNFGACQWHGATNYPTKNISINDYYYSVFQNNTTELISHEIGHCNGLADVSNIYVLMRSAGYKGDAYPESDDISGINQLY